MYKKLLDKGFKPIYYTDADFFEATINNESRLFYRLELTNVDLIKIIINKLSLHDRYFWIFIEEGDSFCNSADLEIDENLNDAYLYLKNTELDNIKIPMDVFKTLLDELPLRAEYLDIDC